MAVREALQTDAPFILSSWFESYWKNHARRTGINYEAYRAHQDALIKALIVRSKVYVAYPSHLPDEIVGYSVLEGNVLHYVYVKSVYRRMGVATGLVRKAARIYTHAAEKPGRRFAESLGLQFNPYLAGILP